MGLREGVSMRTWILHIRIWKNQGPPYATTFAPAGGFWSLRRNVPYVASLGMVARAFMQSLTGGVPKAASHVGPCLFAKRFDGERSIAAALRKGTWARIAKEKRRNGNMMR